MTKDICCPYTKKAIGLARCKIYLAEKCLLPFMLLATRLYMGNIFWKSGLTKWNSADHGADLFKTEYIPNWTKNSADILGMDLSWTTPMNPELTAKMAMLGELGLPILLVLGLGGRIGAFGLLIMTLAIDAFVYPQYAEHNYWMLIFGLLTLTGPGKISIDHFIRRKFLDDGGCAKKSCD